MHRKPIREPPNPLRIQRKTCSSLVRVVPEARVELPDALAERRSNGLRRDAAEFGEEGVVVD
jgi:hypothetical protein